MKKARELTKVGEEETLSSGVMVTVVPFPAGLMERLQSRSLLDFPDPIPPKKTIKVVDGTEEIDDLNDPEYLAQKAEVERQRANRLGEAILDFCVQVDLSQYQSVMRRLERYQGPWPDDPDDRRIAFLESYAFRTAGDYQVVTLSAMEQTTISTPEVDARLASFRDKMERAGSDGTEASSIDAGQRVALPGADA